MSKETITIVNPVLVVAPASVPFNQVEKLEKFNGTEFKRRQQKMHFFFLSRMNLAKFLYEATYYHHFILIAKIVRTFAQKSRCPKITFSKISEGTRNFIV